MKIRSILCFILILAGFTRASLRPSEPTTQPATMPTADDLSTPRKTMLADDKYISSGASAEGYAVFYDARTDDEKTMVAEIGKYEHITGALEGLVRKKFGDDACTAMMRACHEEALPDIMDAKITIIGDLAAIHYQADNSDDQMIKIDGKWVWDAGWLLKKNTLDSMLEFMHETGPRIQAVADGLESGKYTTGEEVIQAIDAAMAK